MRLVGWYREEGELRPRARGVGDVVGEGARLPLPGHAGEPPGGEAPEELLLQHVAGVLGGLVVMFGSPSQVIGRGWLSFGRSGFQNRGWCELMILDWIMFWSCCKGFCRQLV